MDAAVPDERSRQEGAPQFWEFCDVSHLRIRDVRSPAVDLFKIAELRRDCPCVDGDAALRAVDKAPDCWIGGVGKLFHFARRGGDVFGQSSAEIQRSDAQRSIAVVELRRPPALVFPYEECALPLLQAFA